MKKRVLLTYIFTIFGTKPLLTSFEEKTGKRGAMISAVDLLKGIAVGAGMKVVQVEGADHNRCRSRGGAVTHAGKNHRHHQ